ncbi:hypothetical protein G5B40_09655 [Pikeienuella piscinae]|uniref:Phage holin family protein n=1 Tax=Pikeienuella piscinae TaxID=2748098 RepID=A0A7L5BYU3_9RHOB|nr:hypothetical protein [Pikeienuella piscinae]QIE55687.1 hypothetical protein G5B40_09655 [Pikeienuella piscinae]
MRDITATVRAAAEDMISAAAPRVVIAGLTGISALLACAFALAALWTALAQALGPAAASLILALIFFILALGLNAYARYQAAQRRKAKERAARAAPPPRPLPPLEEAFLAAIRIGRGLRR